MLFYFSKGLWFLLQPSSLIALMLTAGLLLRAPRFFRTSRALLWSGTLALAVFGLSPIGGVLILPLEERFSRPDPAASQTRIDGIIVLGGLEDSRVGSLRGVMALNEAGERLVEAVVLAERFPDAKLIFTGGSAELFNSKLPEALAVADYFKALGIARERLMLETKSRNTHENAAFTRAVVQPKPGERWLLVTSAYHMPRAIGCFRKAGFPVIAYPVDYRTSGWDEIMQPFSSIPEGLRRMDFVLKEYTGLVSYYLSGRTDALFPGPDTAGLRE